MAGNGKAPVRVMRIQARPGSPVERHSYEQDPYAPGSWDGPTQIADGVDPDPNADLVYHGGKIVPQMAFRNIYLGGQPAWQAGDIASIDAASKLAMQFRDLNNVVAQYFQGQRPSCDALASLVMDGAAAAALGEDDIKTLVTRLYDESLVSKSDLDSTIFNLILPSGTVLSLQDQNSLNGLGGYHGSLHIERGGKPVTLYYSANVYSQMVQGGGENGIVAFDVPWKNVVATLYHEMNEFRTDPDVNDAHEKGDAGYLGWTAERYEIGDQPIAVAPDLSAVFQEVSAGNGKTVPVQFLYSNSVHGAEGPIDEPRDDATPTV